MKILVFSDLHLEFLNWVPPRINADVVVMAGDIHVGNAALPWIREHFPEVPVLYVFGNHEYYQQIIPELFDAMSEETAGTNIHLMERRTMTIGGVTFFGCTLWTDLALYQNNPFIGIATAQTTMSDYRLIRTAPRYRPLKPEDTIAYHKRSVRWLTEGLESCKGPSVVISHHCPSPLSLDPAYPDMRVNASFASSLDSLITHLKPTLWVHGHVHRAIDYELGATRVVCNPKGYPTEHESGFKADLVVDI